MRHTPRLPDDSVNVSKTHPLKNLVVLVAGLLACLVALFAVAMFVAEHLLLLVPPETEARLFEKWVPDDLFIDDVEADERIAVLTELLERLQQHWPDQVSAPYSFRVQIQSSPDANALAFPGGLIVVTTELLDQVESENELAFVLAHELGHFYHRDHVRGLGQGVAMAILSAALFHSSDSNFGITVGGLTGRSFSRRAEQRADVFGLTMVQAEYGHVSEALRFFERSNQEYAGALDKYGSYLTTHPSFDARVDSLKSYSTGQGWRTSGGVRQLHWTTDASDTSNTE